MPGVPERIAGGCGVSGGGHGHDHGPPGAGHCRDQLQQCLAGHFDVEHSTVQFEPASHAAHEHAAHA